jgi:hypothetical protein
VAITGPLLVEDGAYLLVEFDQRERQVLVTTTVHLDLPDRSLNEPPQSQICTTMTAAHEHALEVAASRTLPVTWEGAEFHARAYFNGRGWQADWAIREGIFELESDSTEYPIEETARDMIKVDARNRGHSSVKWEDGSVEQPALAW